MLSNHNINIEKESVSVVIPALDDLDNLLKIVECLNSQSLLPSEIIIVDSSSDNKIEKYLSDQVSRIPIKYKRAGWA